MKMKTVKIVGRPKGSNDPWVEMAAIKVEDEEDARDKIRRRSDMINNAIDMAIKTTIIEEVKERINA
jgi:hypothetical protein